MNILGNGIIINEYFEVGFNNIYITSILFTPIKTILIEFKLNYYPYLRC
jgi:hypothetical protein